MSPNEVTASSREPAAPRPEAALDRLTKALVLRRLPLLLTVALLAIVADQATKFMAVKHLTHNFGEQSDWQRFMARKPVASSAVNVVPGYWDHHYVENDGAAFGMMANVDEKIRAPFFFLLTLAAAGFMTAYYLRSPERFTMRRWALMLILGGALGNFIDRVRLGYVIDFVQWHYHDKYWPTFNVADAFISVGVVFLMLESFFYKEEKDAA